MKKKNLKTERVAAAVHPAVKRAFDKVCKDRGHTSRVRGEIIQRLIVFWLRCSRHDRWDIIEGGFYMPACDSGVLRRRERRQRHQESLPIGERHDYGPGFEAAMRKIMGDDWGRA